MHKSIKHRSRELKVSDWNYTESSNLSKRTQSTLHSKSSNFVSKYSINKDILNQKLLSDELKKHGRSIVYNFKYKNIMQPQSQIKILNEEQSSQNYVSPTETLTERKYRIKLNPLDNIKPFELDNDTDKIHTSQLKEKIRAFLQPDYTNESQTALNTFEAEISQLKEKQALQKEMIFKALNTSETDMFQEKLVYLTKKNLHASLIKKRIAVPNIQSPAGNSGFIVNQLRINEPNQITVNNRNKMNLKDTSLNNLPQVSLTTRVNPTIQFYQDSPTKRDSKLQSVQEINSPQRFKQTLEDGKRNLEGQFSPIKSTIREKKVLPNLHSSLVNHTFSSHIINQSNQGPQKPSKKVNPLLRQRLVKIIKNLARKIERLGLSVDEIFTRQVFPSQPFQRPESVGFFKSVKMGDFNRVRRYLDQNKYLIYDFDATKQTALHWAARRGYSKIVKHLLEHGADPDARDISGRTPLFFAAKGNHLVSLKLLLYHGCNPMIKSDGNKLAMDYAGKEELIRITLRKAYRVHILLGDTSGKRYKAKWEAFGRRDFEVRESEIE